MAIGALLGLAGSALGGAGKKDLVQAGIGTAVGIGQAVAGKIKQKKADAMIPAEEDPMQRMMLNQLTRQQRAYQTGTANNASRVGMQQAMQSGIKESFKRGATARGLNAMNQMYTQGIQGLNAQDIQGAGQAQQMRGALLNQMAQRKLELGMERYDREQARSAQLLTDGKRNIGSSLARLAGNDEKKKKDVNTSTEE